MKILGATLTKVEKLLGEMTNKETRTYLLYNKVLVLSFSEVSFFEEVAHEIVEFEIYGS